MLHIYQSNHLETLGEFFAAMLRKVPLYNAFEPEKIIVQSRGMSRWLNLKLANANGIAANLDFTLPAAFSWQIIRQTINNAQKESPFSSDVLLWRIFDLLLKLNHEPVFAPLLHYLQANNNRQNNAFELAGKIADVYDQYLVYRADWLQAWENQHLLGLGADEIWQASLWRELKLGSLCEHKAALLNQTIDKISAKNLPQRLSLFGISSLAPSHLHLIKKISKLTDVCLFALNPCQEYWGDIFDQKSSITTNENTIEVSALLASFGKQGRDFFEAIGADAELQSHNLFQSTDGDSLLSRLQCDILQLKVVETIKPSKVLDSSIAVHVAHSELREMEILKDQLLASFAANPELNPADVAVLTPDIQKYAPFIHAVFAERSDNAANIPYSIADCPISLEHQLLLSFSRLLNLIDGRFLAEDILSLLECQALCRRFDFSNDDLTIIRSWLKKSGIRWARDVKQQEDLGLPSTDSHSWRHGLDCLLLGVMLPDKLLNDEQPTFCGLVPVNSANNALVLARFASLFDYLASLAQQWNLPATADTWLQRLNQVTNDLFLTDESDLIALDLWQKTLNQLTENTNLANYQQDFSLSVLRDWLSLRMQVSTENSFLNGKVTFCAMVPMRSLPFRHLCLVGLNSESFPRQDKSPSFDLIKKHARLGDRARRDDDKYLFLEAILSAREKLYLSYVGRSLRSNEALPPSTLLDELIDTLEKMGATREQLITEHPLQAFSINYYNAQSSKLFSFEPTYAFAWQKQQKQTKVFAVKLADSSDAKKIDWNDFLYFWCLPARFWLKRRLNLSPIKSQDEDLNHEAFSLDMYAQNHINQALLDCRVQQRSSLALQQKLIVSADLPPGDLGKVYLQEAQNISQEIVLPDAITEEKTLPAESFQLKLDDFCIQGSLSGLRKSGMYHIRLNDFSASAKIQAWLEHLLLNVLRPEKTIPQTFLLGLSMQQKFPILEKAWAIQELKKWLTYWEIGQQQALAFFPKTSLNAAEELHKQKSEQEALNSAKNVYMPSYQKDNTYCESNNPAIKLAFRAQDALADELFLQMASDLLLPMLSKLE